MIDILEKIAAGAASFLALLTLGMYAFLGLPSTAVVADLPSVVEAPEKAPPPPPAGAAPSPAPPADQAILDRLREQGVKIAPNQGLIRKSLTVPAATYEHVSRTSNWIPELKKVEGRVITTNGKPTRIRLTAFQQDSLLRKLGFQENDTIELINGEVKEFTESKSYDHQRDFEKALARLRGGGDVTVTVTRGGRPHHLTFKL